MNVVPDQANSVLSRAIDEILHYLWDPMGVAGDPESRAAYASYVPELLDLLQAQTPRRLIAAHLSQIAWNQIGVLTSEPTLDRTLDALIEWRDYLADRVRST